jgi:hypothetical protein
LKFSGEKLKFAGKKKSIHIFLIMEYIHLSWPGKTYIVKYVFTFTNIYVSKFLFEKTQNLGGP